VIAIPIGPERGSTESRGRRRPPCQGTGGGTREFHISRQARDRYDFGEGLFSLHGNVIFADFHAARLFAQKMNDRRDLLHFPERVIRAGQINAMGLIDEILHYVVGLFREQSNSRALGP
jgi:hypothetical protein